MEYDMPDLSLLNATIFADPVDEFRRMSKHSGQTLSTRPTATTSTKSSDGLTPTPRPLHQTSTA